MPQVKNKICKKGLCREHFLIIVFSLIQFVSYGQMTPERINAMRLTEEANQKLEGGKFSEAYNIAMKAVKSDANYFKGYIVMGLSLYKQNLMSSAVETLNQALELAPENEKERIKGFLKVFDDEKRYTAFMQEAQRAELDGKLGIAAAQYEKAWNIFPMRGKAGVEAARVYGTLGEYLQCVRLAVLVKQQAGSEFQNKATELISKYQNKITIIDPLDRELICSYSLSKINIRDVIAMCDIAPDNVNLHITAASYFAYMKDENNYDKYFNRLLNIRELYAEQLFQSIYLIRKNLDKLDVIRQKRGYDFYSNYEEKLHKLKTMTVYNFSIHFSRDGGSNDIDWTTSPRFFKISPDLTVPSSFTNISTPDTRVIPGTTKYEKYYTEIQYTNFDICINPACYNTNEGLTFVGEVNVMNYKKIDKDRFNYEMYYSLTGHVEYGYPSNSKYMKGSRSGGDEISGSYHILCDHYLNEDGIGTTNGYYFRMFHK